VSNGHSMTTKATENSNKGQIMHMISTTYRDAYYINKIGWYKRSQMISRDFVDV